VLRRGNCAKIVAAIRRASSLLSNVIAHGGTPLLDTFAQIWSLCTICDVGVKILRKASAVTSVTVTIAVSVLDEGIMSLLYHSNEKADLKRTDYTDRTDYGFILALFCMVLALVVASAIFRPAPVGTGIEITDVGP
jgi:hypothetical protein